MQPEDIILWSGSTSPDCKNHFTPRLKTLVRTCFHYFRPLALKAAAYRLNTLSVNAFLMIPLSSISGSSSAIQCPDCHTWGCPVYILEAGFQSTGPGIPKKDPRSRLGIYVGRSPFHAGSVVLILNPKTGHVSPQYHVVFDDNTRTSFFTSIIPSQQLPLLQTYVTREMNYMSKVAMNFDGTSNFYHPFAFASSLSDNEDYTLKEMMPQPDVPKFIQAMID